MIGFIVMGTIFSYIIKAMPYILGTLFCYCLFMVVKGEMEKRRKQASEKISPQIPESVNVADLLHIIYKTKQSGELSSYKTQKLRDLISKEGPTKAVISTVYQECFKPKPCFSRREKIKIGLLIVLIPIAIVISYLTREREKNVSVAQVQEAPVSQAAKTESPEVKEETMMTAKYILEDLDVSSSEYNKQVEAKIIVADGLDESILRNTVVRLARELQREYPSSRVVVFAYKASDEDRSYYSAARCIIAPTGTIEEADISMFYNMAISDEERVSKIPEAQRKTIFKAFCAAERNARKTAQIVLIKKYNGKELPISTSENTLTSFINQIYTNHNAINLIQEEEKLRRKYLEELNSSIEKKYGITREEGEKILFEGLAKRWGPR